MKEALLNQDQTRSSFSKLLPAFIFGMAFAVMLVFLSTYLIPWHEPVPWEQVSGYFVWFSESFWPAVSLYLANQARRAWESRAANS